MKLKTFLRIRRLFVRKIDEICKILSKIVELVSKLAKYQLIENFMLEKARKARRLGSARPYFPMLGSARARRSKARHCSKLEYEAREPLEIEAFLYFERFFALFEGEPMKCGSNVTNTYKNWLSSVKIGKN